MPVVNGVGSASQLVWKPMSFSVMRALKTFIVVVSSTLAWEEVETFLLENFWHPHFFLREIVMELWCFIVCHAEIEMVKNTIDHFVSLYKLVVSSELFLMPGSALRKMAKCICTLITNAPQSIVDQAYSSFVTDDKSPTTSIIYIINLLIEGFPLNLLSDQLKRKAAKRLIIGYHSFVESNFKKLRVDKFSRFRSFALLGGLLYALSSALHCLQITRSDVDDKTLKFTIALIHGCRNAKESLKDTYCKILNQTLAIISVMKHLYASSQIREVILELHNLFSMRSVPSDAWLNQWKPGLVLFMVGLSHMDIAEVEGSPVISAICEIHHMLLRERDLSFVHLEIRAFGYFAAQTSCSQHWRFSLQDAELFFDTVTGCEAIEVIFVSELNAFLEKILALHVVVPCAEQLTCLVSENLILKELIGKNLATNPEDSISDDMETNLQQSGLKIMGDGLSQLPQQNFNSMEFSSCPALLHDYGTILCAVYCLDGSIIAGCDSRKSKDKSKWFTDDSKKCHRLHATCFVLRAGERKASKHLYEALQRFCEDYKTDQGSYPTIEKIAEFGREELDTRLKVSVNGKDTVKCDAIIFGFDQNDARSKIIYLYKGRLHHIKRVAKGGSGAAMTGELVYD
ncbi:hypothetical protein IFM89_026832 [Coptis chinensis]|uniref:Uncharacterized protein n=1 Tax=Coptis chinensis TaxID=261450 RepID=A0A835H0S5_9MAGN|nr:hypothetical protein IFM89_026832 [Coptis chinensis]